jgi:hypothetical protein
MGNTSSMLIFWVSISMFSMLITLGIVAIDPCSNNLFTSYITTNNNIVGVNAVSQTHFCTNGVVYTENYSFNNRLQDQIPSRATTGDTGSVGSTTSVQFPDWLQSGWSFLKAPLTIGAYILNLIGAPYTLLMSFGLNPNVATILGIGFSILNLFFIVNWILGRDN